MKKLLKKGMLPVSLIIGIILVFQSISLADSPITSTQFYKAYMDLEIVEKASNTKIIDQSIANYLMSKDNAIDNKAAVINALGWNFNGKKNASDFCKLAYGKDLDMIDMDSISGEELFCIGYMKALDDYFHPEKALPYLEKANTKIKDSLTVSLITAIVKAQIQMHNGNWNSVWTLTKTVLEDKTLKQDMRKDAVGIIKDYMIPYGSSEGDKSDSDYMVLKIKSSYSFINGNKTPIDSQNPDILPIVENGRTLVPIRFISENMGAKVSWDAKTSTATINSGNNASKIVVGSNQLLINNKKLEIDVPARIIEGRLFIPLRVLCENVLNREIYYKDNIIIIGTSQNISKVKDDSNMFKDFSDLFK